MKRIFILIFGLVSTVVCFAQDLIVKSDGDEIKAKVLSVDEDKVSYKKWSNKSGPTYSLSTDLIFMIKYENGEKDLFSADSDGKKSSVSTNPSTDGVTGYIEKQPAANNVELINKYNPNVKFRLKKGGTARRIMPVLALEGASILSNEDVEMNFVRKIVRTKYNFTVLRYYVEIKNKTNNVIYIDKGNSFRTVNNISIPFYDTKQVSVSKGSGSGVGVGLGAIANAVGVGGVVGQLANGVSVGGGSSSTVSTTYSQQRILAIPPHSSAYMSEYKYDNYKGNKWEKISEAEYYSFPFKPLKKGECIEYTADNTPCTYKYFIAYSIYPDFRSYSSVRADLYVKYMIGISDFKIGWGRDETTIFNGDRLIKRYKKIIPNFEAEESLIIGDI